MSGNNFLAIAYSVVKKAGYETKGMTKDQVVKKFKELSTNKKLKKEEINNHKFLKLQQQEYAELCSAIRTKYGNKIKNQGGILYNNHFYV